MTIERLEQYGADTAEGLRRCLNNESFYLRMVGMVPQDSNFQKLFDAVDAEDMAAAFEAAHAIKGSTGNLALNPIFLPANEMTELLRAGTKMDYTELTAAIRKGFDELCEICAQ